MAEDLEFKKIISNDVFYKEIDNLVKGGLKYMDAIVYYCERNGMEIEAAAVMIKSNNRIKSHIQIEGEDLNFLPRTARLPV